MRIAAAVTGWGTAVPPQRLTNADLEARLDTSDAWIVERTGIRERRIAAASVSTSDLAVEAAIAALDRAGLGPRDVDLLVLATATPDQPLPQTAAFVQERLGLSCGAFDLGAACAGFVYALVTGSALLSAGSLRAVLVVGAETLSRIVDPDDRSTSVLFGDGAGAAVLTPARGAGLLAWDLGSDGSASGLLAVPAGGSRRPASQETLAKGEHWLRMDGSEVFRRAVRVLVASASATLARAEVGPEAVDLFVPHQANQRIVDAAISRLGLDPERTFVNLDRYGNTSAASIPMALAEAADAGRVQPGDRVLMSGFGAGMAWASALVEWEEQAA